MERCKNCKFWDGEPGDHLGSCFSDKFVQNYPDEVEVNRNDLFDRLFHDNDENISCDLYTEENFGCVHFELREEKI